ncbi:hypothetical protein BDV10DRAFT_178830 [Aspergillus recurvatus]
MISLDLQRSMAFRLSILTIAIRKTPALSLLMHIVSGWSNCVARQIRSSLRASL